MRFMSPLRGSHAWVCSVTGDFKESRRQNCGFEAEGTGLEPATPYGAHHFQ